MIALQLDNRGEPEPEHKAAACLLVPYAQTWNDDPVVCFCNGQGRASAKFDHPALPKQEIELRGKDKIAEFLKVVRDGKSERILHRLGRRSD